MALLLLQNFAPYVRACDTSNPNYAYYSTNYSLKIISLNSDKNSYMPGDTATVSGTVALQGVDVYYSSDCNLYSYGNPYTADPTGVVVVLSTGATTAADSNGGFSFSIPIPTDASAGSTQYTVTATHTSSGATDSAAVTITVTPYGPKIAVTGGSSYYPGDTIVFAGAGWIPGQPVTVQFLGLQAQETGPTFSGNFVIPDDASEGSASIAASQTPNLQATTSITVQWRPLTLSLTTQGLFFVDGNNIAITGTVTSNNGPVEGAAVAVTYTETLGGTSLTAGGTTAADGTFNIPLSLPAGAWAKYQYLLIQYRSGYGSAPFQPQGTVSATATKSPGYKSPSNTASYTALVQGPQSNGDINTVLEVAEFPLGGLTMISLGQVAAVAEANAWAAAAGLATTSLALPVAVLVVSAGAFVGISYYLARNPTPPRKEYAGGVRG